MTLTLSCTVNGASCRHYVQPLERLSDFLRDQLLLTGTNIGCGEGVCGSCTVLVDGVATRSCLVLAAQCEGAAIETVEGLTTLEGELSRVQALFYRHNAFQCGFCTSGYLMVVEELARAHAQTPLGGDEINDRLSSVVCRCTGYLPVRRAVEELLGVEH